MSWNASFIAINKDLSGQLDKLQTVFGVTPGEPLDTISWLDATSQFVSGLSIGMGSGWTIICDPFMFWREVEFESPGSDEIWLPSIEEALKNHSMGGKALGFIMGGVSDIYAMTIHIDGKCVRRRLVQEGETLIDFGAPRLEEVEAFDQETDEEARVFLLMEKYGLPFPMLEGIKFNLYGRPTAA